MTAESAIIHEIEVHFADIIQSLEARFGPDKYIWDRQATEKTDYLFFIINESEKKVVLALEPVFIGSMFKEYAYEICQPGVDLTEWNWIMFWVAQLPGGDAIEYTGLIKMVDLQEKVPA